MFHFISLAFVPSNISILFYILCRKLHIGNKKVIALFGHDGERQRERERDKWLMTFSLFFDAIFDWFLNCVKDYYANGAWTIKIRIK